ncbi:MAG: hypothetical protein ACAH83_08740 [Alphaproteobacteria bacterium]
MANFEDGKLGKQFSSTRPVQEIDVDGVNLAELLFKTELVDAGKGFGVRAVKGPLLLAMEEDKPVRLLNVSKARPESVQALQQVVSLLNGELPMAVFHNPMNPGEKVTIEGSKLGNFELQLSGVNRDDGKSSLSPSMLSRLRPGMIK